MTFTVEDKVEAWSRFLAWWRDRETDRPAQDEYYAKDVAGAAWLAACQWCETLRGDP